MTIFEEIGEIHLLKGDYEKQVLQTLENKGFYARLDTELEDENIYYIVVETQ